MKKLSLLAGAAALGALAVPAIANAQAYGYDYGYGYKQPVRNTACERQRKSDKTAGALVGAIGGALIGGAIGNNVDDGDAGWYRSGRGWGHHGHHGSRWHYYGGNGNSDEVAAGAILGAIVGGVAGSAIADSNSRDCVSVPSYNYPAQTGYQTGYQNGYPYTPPPPAYRRDDLYGGPQSADYPDYPEYDPYPEYQDYQQAPAPQYNQAPQAPPVRQAMPVTPQPVAASGDCRTIQRQTRAPDGRIVYDPITTCRDPYSGAWQIRDGVNIGN